jgi:hypothetical protein
MARGTYEGFKEADENEPWTIHIRLKGPPSEEDSEHEGEPVDGEADDSDASPASAS